MTFLLDLAELECPVNWHLSEAIHVVSDTRKRVSFKVDHEVGEDDESSTWQKVCQYLVMCLLEYRADDFKAMGSYLKKIEDIMMEAKADTLMKKHVPAIDYVTKGMQAHYLYKLDDEENAKAIIVTLKPLEELSKKDQAACYALKSCCFMEFTYSGFEAALLWIEKALELDPDDPEWNFLKGKCLARTRRFTSKRTQPSLEELQCLGKSAKGDDCSPYHLVFCAQSLLEYAQNCHFIQRDPNTARSYYTKCAELFRRAALRGENNGVVLIRTGKGLMHLFDYGIEDLLEHCVFRSLELLPTSGFVNAVVGEWYYIRAKNIDKAIPYLRVASREHKIMSSYRYLLSILFLYKSKEELYDEVKIFWENYRDSPADRVKALKPLASYFFFLKDDILSAAFYMKMWLEHVLDQKSDDNDKCSMFIFCNDLTSAIVGEINNRLNDPHCNINSDDEDELRAFLEVVTESRPHLNVRKLRITREETLRSCIYKSCKDPELKKRLISIFNVKPPGYSNNNRTHWRK